MDSASEIAETLLAGETLRDEVLILDLAGYRIAIRSNSQPLLTNLRHYFRHVEGKGSAADIDVLAIERPVVELDVAFTDWKREPGKTGRKDAYHDLVDGRLVRKVRTGMLFLQSESQRIACGPCLQFESQVINFVNSQYMNWLQQRGALICHAAGVVTGGSCLGIAGFSGGGKSTLMLRLMEDSGTAFLTNDRLFLDASSGQLAAIGIPKLPRVNPGTIVSLPALNSLVSADRRESLLAMPKHELWELEEKHDVYIADVYGPDRIVSRAGLDQFLILNWQRDSEAECQIREVSLEDRPELVDAVMKSPGPFYRFASGEFYRDDMELDRVRYAELFQDIRVWEACGRIDFDAAVAHCRKIMGAQSCSESC